MALPLAPWAQTTGTDNSPSPAQPSVRNLPLAPWASSSPEPVYDAALFKQRVGRDPEPTELANFQANKGVGWAGDPTQGRFTAGQAAVGGLEDVTSLGTGALAAIPASLAYIAGALGIGEGSKENARAVQSGFTFVPRTAAGQSGLQTIGQIASGPVETLANVADRFDSTGKGLYADTIRDVAERTADVAPLFTLASPVIRGVHNELTNTRIPVGTQFDRTGTAITPRRAPAQNPSPPVGAAAPELSVAPGAPRDTSVPDVGNTPEYFEPPKADGEVSEPVSTPEQDQREQVLRAVGLSEVRNSALTGDSAETGFDFQASKLKNKPGDRMREVVNGENDALRSYSEQRIAEAGGSTGDSQALSYARGVDIADPVQQLSDFYENGIKAVYKDADGKAGKIPFVPQALNQAVADRAAFLGTVEGKQLLEGVQARMADLGMVDGEGTPQPVTVQQAERLRQYLGDQWTPRTAKLIGQMKDSLDDDVAAQAGGNVYQMARALREQRAKILDDPTGIAALASPEDKLGINRQVPYEKVPDYVANLPVQQFQHVINTLKSVPQEIQPAAQKALLAIRSHFANRVDSLGRTTQGMWNTKAVNQYLRDNVSRMSEVFTPDEMTRYKTLNDAGNILKMDRTYPGGAAQQYNYAAHGLNIVGEGAEALGMHLGGAPGYLVGKASQAGLKKATDKMVMKDIENRIRKLD